MTQTGSQVVLVTDGGGVPVPGAPTRALGEPLGDALPAALRAAGFDDLVLASPSR